MRVNANSEPPEQQELYDLPDILEPYPRIARSKENRGHVVARPSIVSGEKYEDVSRAYIRTLHSVLIGEEIPSVAAVALEKELIQITGFKPGSPSKGVWPDKAQ
jgi:trehalose/maltose transport system substrate-binding protein